jgi:hypothetical protein
MRFASAVFAALLFAAGSAAAVDFDKLDRRILKEPTYQSKPLYGLALLGPDATTRVWLALDGERLYVDKNCNGDLTDDGPPAELKSKDSDPASYESIDVSPDGGRTVYKFEVTLWGRPSFAPGATDREPFNQSVHITFPDGRMFGAWGDHQKPLIFASGPRDAPAMHFGGDLVTGNPNSPSFAVAGLSAPPDVSADRLHGRAELSRRLDQTGGPSGSYADMQSKALDLLLSPSVSTAFDLSREAVALRDKYGRHAHGQSCLLARRLIEAGSRLVTVNWPDDGQAFWDTHGNNFPSLKNRLMPPADMAFAALLDDLTARGLLDETLVIWVGEFGRTPRIENGGRQHWPQCYSAVLAGGGIQGGAVYGASDKNAAYPADRPVSPADLTATMYHALGIDLSTEIHDPTGRPWRIADGTPIQQLFT